MKYVSHRNITVASVCGLSMEFKKGEPAFAPPGMHKELLALGVVPVDEPDAEPVATLPNAEPIDPAERKATIFAAFEAISLRGVREEFNGSSIPHAAVLAKELGWSMGAKERDLLWREFTAEKAA